ncbi:PTS galactitol transporter subunit IIC [Pelolinea submarina]|uniref:PTS system galactitol-specific IIC component n=1 Tax=Pelolinea submarina TaxID=913107 RepID=A0A347ZP51_9CHLR|nr:PTS transporter subunit IIC [Pelolinea submarina]REG08684.1 PTS system galactitol-specific IIC component [Pelolinea submarina]BBB47082.1 PTS system, galactitol-specific IIC component [Pelolinea submarina]
MSEIANAISVFFGWINSLGATVMLPIALFLIGIAFGLKPAQSFVNGLRVGIGFYGLNLMTGAIASTVGPLANALVERTGLALSIPDVGVAVHFPITFSLTAAAFMIPLGILVNVVMLLLKLTKTVDIDVWNFWPSMFSWACVQGLTGSAFYGFLAFVFTVAISLVLGDMQAKYIEKYYNMPGISFPHPFSSFFGLLAWPFMWLFDRIPGIKDWNADIDSLQKKIGPLGNSTVFGLVIGIGLSFLGGYDVIKALQTGVVVAAILLLLPEMLKVLMSGLFPISEAARKWLTQRFPGREFYIGLDCAVGVAQPSAVIVAVLLIPITLVMATILPGNKLLPLADLAYLGFWVAMPMAMFKNNIVKGVLFGAFAIGVSMLMATSIAPLVTRLAVEAGTTIPEGVSQISMLTVYPWAWVTTWFSSLFTGGIF